MRVAYCALRELRDSKPGQVHSLLTSLGDCKDCHGGRRMNTNLLIMLTAVMFSSYSFQASAIEYEEQENKSGINSYLADLLKKRESRDAKVREFVGKTLWYVPIKNAISKERFFPDILSARNCWSCSEGGFAPTEETSFEIVDFVVIRSKELFPHENWPSPELDMYFYRVRFPDGKIGYYQIKSANIPLIISRNAAETSSFEFFATSQAEFNEIQARLSEERENARKLAAQEEAKAAPGILKEMDRDLFCVAYGAAIRGEAIHGVGILPSDTIIKYVKAEARRRKLQFDDSLTRDGKIKLGITKCKLYASWGLPDDENESVGRWGTHIQHIYGVGTYVYTENGRVTSWQD